MHVSVHSYVCIYMRPHAYSYVCTRTHASEWAFWLQHAVFVSFAEDACGTLSLGSSRSAHVVPAVGIGAGQSLSKALRLGVQRKLDSIVD